MPLRVIAESRDCSNTVSQSEAESKLCKNPDRSDAFSADQREGCLFAHGWLPRGHLGFGIPSRPPPYAATAAPSFALSQMRRSLRSATVVLRFFTAGHECPCQARVEWVGFIENPRALLLGANVDVKDLDRSLKIVDHGPDHRGLS